MLESDGEALQTHSPFIVVWLVLSLGTTQPVPTSRVLRIEYPGSV